MFGSYKEELDDLREYLLSETGMRPRYTSAFLSAYGRRMAKRLRKAKQTIQGKGLAGRFTSPADRMGLLAGGVLDLGVAVVAIAYGSYMGDLRRGKHVGTDVEKAIWAILYEHRDDELSELDAGLAQYIREHVKKKFPMLYDDILGHAERLDDDWQPFPITDDGARPEGQPRKGQPILEEPPFGDPGTEPSLVFMGSMPLEGRSPTLVIPFGDRSQVDAEIKYYENPKTIGCAVGITDLFKYSHLAVVRVIGDQDARLIVRVEDGGFGPPMLCSLDQSGAHENFGEWPQILEGCRDEIKLDESSPAAAHADSFCFIKKAIEIARPRLPPGALDSPPWKRT